MRLTGPELSGRHLTYCTNVHPGESWDEVAQALSSHVLDVKTRVAPREPFGVGLRLSAQACRELEAGDTLAHERARLEAAGLYVFTLNGFPYGAFHAVRVKERVYRPDWLEPARVAYTLSLARVLAALLPEGLVGSISTVPLCFAERAAAEPDALGRMARELLPVVAELARWERESGKELVLALEPEPCCALETTAEAIAFFEDQLCARAALGELARLTGLDVAQAERALRRHLGVCLDTCHAAVEFERPLDALRALRAAGIGVPKIQLSAALRLRPEPEALRALAAFADDVYLHQVVVRAERAGGPDGARALSRFVDLPEALAAAPALPGEWRVHFHVPIFASELGELGSTQRELEELLREARSEELSPHLEVETYTFDVLPARFRDTPVAESVARELAWVLGVLGERASPRAAASESGLGAAR